jgi:asparagine synthase (glutamine-hydrolysing)
MTGICGIVNRDGAPVDPAELARFCAAMPEWGRDGFGTWVEGPAALAQGRWHARTPQARYEHLPRRDPERGFAITANGRLDNFDELISELHLAGDRARIPDGDVIAAAHARWGADAPERLYGDWAYAAWEPAERRLLLARDHIGNTAMYYCVTDTRFAFASSRHALHALGMVRSEIDDLYVAQVLVVWPAYNGERTVHPDLHRLVPAHTLTVTPERLVTRRYWDVRAVEPLALPSRADYVDGFLEVFDRAVATRMRTRDRVGISLSGGLDSGAVAVTAARVADASMITAFTSVPAHDTAAYVGGRMGDELALATATAAAARIQLVPIPGTAYTPMAALRRALAIFREPVHAATNMFWMLDLDETAVRHGCSAVLNGGAGNATISWVGDWRSQPLRLRFAEAGLATTVRSMLGAIAPAGLQRLRRSRAHPAGLQQAVINPDLVRRLELLDRYAATQPLRPSPLERRLRIIHHGVGNMGHSQQTAGAAAGIDPRDPTRDVRVIEFTFAVPDRIFIDPATGTDRWLVRQAMVDRLPDEVRQNARRGRQAADVVPRLRACRAAVDEVLEEVAHGPATDYLDVTRLRAHWRLIQEQDSMTSYLMATAFERGLLAGLFVNSVR